MNNSQHSSQPSGQEPKPEMVVQRLYVKDLSLECPNSPLIFKDQWKPELKLELNVSDNLVEPEIYEVVVHIVVTATNQEKVAFLIELAYGGVISLKNFQQQQLEFVLGAVVPSIIFPYAREVISDQSVRAGFPPLILAPVNFDALYAQKKAQMASEHGSQTHKDSQPSDVMH